LLGLDATLILAGALVLTYGALAFVRPTIGHITVATQPSA
jgi:hypothetical protein